MPAIVRIPSKHRHVWIGIANSALSRCILCGLTTERKTKPYKLTPYKPPPPKECEVVDECLQLLALKGWRTHRLHCGRAQFPGGRWVTLEPQGTPDWLVVCSGRPAFYLEVKRPGKRATAVQLTMHRMLRDGYQMKIAVVDGAAMLGVWLEKNYPNRGIMTGM